jgi:hypothetical protein
MSIGSPFKFDAHEPGDARVGESEAKEEFIRKNKKLGLASSTLNCEPIESEISLSQDFMKSLKIEILTNGFGGFGPTFSRSHTRNLR